MINQPLNEKEIQRIEKDKKEINKALKSIYSGQITQNFMLEIMYDMINSYPDLQIYISAPKDLQTVLSGRMQNLFNVLCEHIIGVHRSKIIFLSDKERVSLEDDNSYKTELMDDVYKAIKLRHNIDSLIRDVQLIKGDRFLLFPVPYYIAVLESKFLQLSAKSKSMPFVFTNIANKSLAILSLLQDNFADCSYATCRTIIEEYIRGTIFRKCKIAMDEYYKFSKYELKQSISFPPDKELLEKFENRINKSYKNKIDFLHYGWVDVIPEYHEIVDHRPYTFSGIKKFIVEKISDDASKGMFELLDYYHNMCHGYAHGSINNCRYPLLHYFEISSILVNVTFNSYYALCEELDEETSIEGIDVVAEINKHHKILNNAYLKRSTEKFENYYKNFKVN